MIRLVGLVLIWGGCALWGIIEGQRLSRSVRVLENVGWALEVLERELALNRTAIPELMERLAQRGEGAALFSVCRSVMETGVGFAQAWTVALEESELKGEERELLSGLSQVLGRYDAQGQGQALRHLRQEVEQRTIQHRKEARAMGRVYRTLGVTAGGFLSLMLL